LVKRLIYGSSIPALDPSDLAELPIVQVGQGDERQIAEAAEAASALLADADLLERDIGDEAETLTDRFLAGDNTAFALGLAADGERT
jgi:hypothetical protein